MDDVLNGEDCAYEPVVMAQVEPQHVVHSAGGATQPGTPPCPGDAVGQTEHRLCSSTWWRRCSRTSSSAPGEAPAQGESLHESCFAVQGWLMSFRLGRFSMIFMVSTLTVTTRLSRSRM